MAEKRGRVAEKTGLEDDPKLYKTVGMRQFCQTLIRYVCKDSIKTSRKRPGLRYSKQNQT